MRQKCDRMQKLCIHMNRSKVKIRIYECWRVPIDIVYHQIFSDLKVNSLEAWRLTNTGRRASRLTIHGTGPISTWVTYEHSIRRKYVFWHNSHSVKLIMMLFSWKNSGILQEVSGNEAVGIPYFVVRSSEWSWSGRGFTQLSVSTYGPPLWTSEGTDTSFLAQNQIFIKVVVRSIANLKIGINLPHKFYFPCIRLTIHHRCC